MQALGCRRFQHGCHRVNLHRPTTGAHGGAVLRPTAGTGAGADGLPRLHYSHVGVQPGANYRADKWLVAGVDAGGEEGCLRRRRSTGLAAAPAAPPPPAPAPPAVRALTLMYRRKLNLKARFKAIYDILASSAETVCAFNTSFETIRLHRLTLAPALTLPALTPTAPGQGLTLVHFSAQHMHI